jgi:hypothetical protein
MNAFSSISRVTWVYVFLLLFSCTSLLYSCTSFDDEEDNTTTCIKTEQEAPVSNKNNSNIN